MRMRGIEGTVVDTTKLTARPMGKNKRRTFEAYRYYDSSGSLVCKTCTKCGLDKPAEGFGSNSRTVDNLFNYCRSCASGIASAWVTNNKERREEYNVRMSRQVGARYRDKLRMRTTEEVLQRQSAEHPDGTKICAGCEVIKPIDAFYTSRTRVDGLKRYCKSCGFIGMLRLGDEEVLEYWKNKNIPIECYICLGPYEDIEHVVPKALGGTNDMVNLLPACVECNRGHLGKNSLPLAVWVGRRDDLNEEDIFSRVLSYGVDPYPPKSDE